MIMENAWLIPSPPFCWISSPDTIPELQSLTHHPIRSSFWVSSFYFIFICSTFPFIAITFGYWKFPSCTQVWAVFSLFLAFFSAVDSQFNSMAAASSSGWFSSFNCQESNLNLHLAKHGSFQEVVHMGKPKDPLWGPCLGERKVDERLGGGWK